MATLILQAAGAFLGGLLGPVGAALGTAAGSMAGYVIDRALINSTQHHRGPRLQGMRPFSAEEGAPVPRVYGAARVGGTLIWATRFEEGRRSKRQGFKGGAKVTTYSYFANCAFGLCEGPIAGIRRVWADGREVDLTLVDLRVHNGGGGQAPDPLIEARQGAGNTPAYRGMAYVVIDRFPLEDYGNRVPQFQFEVLRPVGGFGERIQAVTLIPGATEFGLSPGLVTRQPRRGETEMVNRHVLHGASDLEASLDELAMLCPNLKNVALVVTWFGDDLRAGECRIEPAVSAADGAPTSAAWRVCGQTMATAKTVSRHDGAAAYGGTPSDGTVIDAIAAIRARGWKVTLYPFVMMDIPQANVLPDPYGGARQAAYPWRGRITCMPGPGRPGSADHTAAAKEQVEHFCGAAEAGDFTAGAGVVGFTGAAGDWGYRRMVLHYAHLAKLAGGVDGFLIGSELRGLTTLRDAANGFPFVGELMRLAADARGVLGPATRITYGADWSEYFGHHPQDGSGDVYFHLDALWAHPAIDAIGIDNYMPLADWRDADHGGGNPDGFDGPCDRGALRRQIDSGEGFDWFYADDAARLNRVRQPITDGLAAKPWVFRYKDVAAWWGNAHHDRVGGVEKPAATAWTPRSKPVWFTELGCAAVDKGPNQPNVFPDPKSTENAIPHFSGGGRSDLAQRRFLAAHFDHWDPASDGFVEGGNPLSGVYGGRMVDPERIFVWAWDARPFPAFPLNADAWADGGNWTRGHWLNGRLAGVELGDLVSQILADHGHEPALAGKADGFVQGFVIEEPSSARQALEPLVELFDLLATEEAGALSFRSADADARPALEIGDAIVVEPGEPAVEIIRTPQEELPATAMLSFRDPMSDYQPAIARMAEAGGGTTEMSLGFPGNLETGQAEALLAGWMRRAWTGRETLRFAVPASERLPAPGRMIRLPAYAEGEFRVTKVEEGLVRRIEARRAARLAPFPDRPRLPRTTLAGPAMAGKPLAIFLDLPLAAERPAGGQFRVALFASPWKTQQVFASATESGFEHLATVMEPAVVGQLVEALGPGHSGCIDHAGAITVRLSNGELSSVATAQLLNGANAAAIRSAGGAWEIVQFGAAEETGASVWRLTELLRGQLGTEDAALAGAAAGADFVLLDDAVQPAGLKASEVGLALNWRAGPSGHEFSERNFAQSSQVGGLRALMPLSPVHLKARFLADGSLAVSWIRRGRLDADGWQGDDIPLGEESEAYRIGVGLPGAAAKLVATVGQPEWTSSAAALAAGFPALPPMLEITVQQISATVGAGLPARITIETPII